MNPYAELTDAQVHILRALQDAGARGPGSAVTLQSMGLQAGADVDALVDLRIVARVRDEPDRVYASLSRAVFSPAIPERAFRLMIVIVIAAMVIGFGWLAFSPPRH